MSEARKKLGKTGEELAAEYLTKKGYQIHAFNVRNRIGELDLVAEVCGQMVIVEVKTKTGLGYGSPEEMVDKRKQQKLIRTAQLYLLEQELLDRPWRIDVVAIRMQESRPEILHIKNAVEGS
jgi:putative endonuclease